MSTKKTPPKKPSNNDDAAPVLLTEFVIASDGLVYVNGASFKPDMLEGRQQFVGYALTEQERRRFFEELHAVSFNVTASTFPKAKKRKR